MAGPKIAVVGRLDCNSIGLQGVDLNEVCIIEVFLSQFYFYQTYNSTAFIQAFQSLTSFSDISISTRCIATYLSFQESTVQSKPELVHSHYDQEHSVNCHQNSHRQH